MHQKVIAVKKDDIAYTSPSTAENQKESVNVYVNAPTMAENSIKKSFVLSEQFNFNLLQNPEIVQKRNKIVNELHKAESIFIDTATWLVAGSANNEKTRPNN